MSKPRVPFLLAVLVLLPWGCGTLPPPPVAPVTDHLAGGGEAAACAAFLLRLDRTVARHGVRDVQAAPVPGFPYLRVDRLLESYRHEATPEQVADWMTAMRRLDLRARAPELRNLPAAAWPQPEVADHRDALARIEECGLLLMELDLRQPRTVARLRAQARAPEVYLDFNRIIGLYPVSARFVGLGVGWLHDRTRADFATPPEQLQVTGELVDYWPPADTPLPPSRVRALLDKAPRDALGIPHFNPQARQTLFATFAPVWRIDVAGEADRPGTPVRRRNGQIAVDTREPRVYRKLSFTRWQDRVLVQLNYILWSPERPRTGPLDLLGGHLDGVVWRVTLAPDGRPLLYDAMHSCGCYHMAFPTRRLQARPAEGGLNEPLLVPSAAPEPAPGERILIRLEHRTHYLQRVAIAGRRSGITYRFDDYDALRSLPDPGDGFRSMFDRRGLVPGSERRERWVLWPMGVPEPGAMRQWGRHATAFIGRRYFDEPFLIERYFEKANRAR